ncbi:uncharacterized protein METZ01_LOCUS313161, partial [marine metagenome]
VILSNSISGSALSNPLSLLSSQPNIKVKINNILFILNCVHLDIKHIKKIGDSQFGFKTVIICNFYASLMKK